MSYLAYNYSDTETLAEIANAFGITLSELMRINNVTKVPYPKKPSQIQNNLNEQILVPDRLTGNESAENRKSVLRDDFMTEQDRAIPKDVYLGGFSGFGDVVQHKCYMTISGINNVSIIYFPCYPEDYTDSCSANFSELNPMGRSEPFQIYQNTGPREVSVSFTMHKEMVHTTPIRMIVDAVRATQYPCGNVDGVDIVPTVTFVITNEVEITGIIKSAPNVKWYGPINRAGRYSMVDLSFTVTECTGNPKTAKDIAVWDSWTEDWNR